MLDQILNEQEKSQTTIYLTLKGARKRIASETRSRRKEVIKIRAETNEIATKKTTKNTMEIRNDSSNR